MFVLQQYEVYSWLWTDDMHEYLNMFLRFARQLEESEKALLAQAAPNEPLDALPNKKPTLNDFRTELDRFLELYNECQAIDDEYVFNKWLKINLRPFKQNILNIICKWSNVLKQHLVDHVNKRCQFYLIYIDLLVVVDCLYSIVKVVLITISWF